MSDFSLLKTFLAVARHQNISRAAEEVHLSQPAVSLQIKQLETTIGSTLFTRHPLRLTDAGKHLREHAQSVLTQWESALSFVQEEKALTTGQLTIACSDTVMRFALLPLIRQYKNRFPGIQLSFLNRTSGSAQQDVVQGRADLAYALSDEPHPKLIHKPFLNYQDVTVMDQQHPLATRKQLTAKLLSQHTLLLLEERTTSRKLFDQWMRDKGYPVAQRMSLGSVDAQLALAKAGLGIALVPDFAAPATMHSLPVRSLPSHRIDLFYQRLKPAALAWLRLMNPDTRQGVITEG